MRRRLRWCTLTRAQPVNWGLAPPAPQGRLDQDDPVQIPGGLAKSQQTPTTPLHRMCICTTSIGPYKIEQKRKNFSRFTKR